MIFLFNRFALVGKLEVHAFHKKCLVLPGTLSFQIPYHKPEPPLLFEPEASSLLASSHKIL